VVIHNTSPDELSDILLRLDHNIFRATVPRGGSVPAETTEGMVVTRLTVDGRSVDLTARPAGRGEPARLAAQGLDQTLARIALAEPIAPGARATLEIEWRTKLPGGPGGRGHRMTQRWGDTLFQPTQWFPRVAKYDDLRGWDTNIYLGPAEFYNNFGRFDVRIDVPAGWIVSGTGILQNPEEVLTDRARERLSRILDSDESITIVGADEMGPGRSTAAGIRLVWHFVADNVNDFAWATAEHFVWEATRATIPGKGAVPIHMVYLPERAHLFERAAELTRHALEFYSDLWAPYPFPQLTLQDGPSAGMEYPMVINSNQGAADHETAHQWWPMMVGTNETWYGWMDEGFDQYMNILSRAHREGGEPNLNGRGQSYGGISGDEAEPPMMWIANYAGNSYGFQTYSKTPRVHPRLGLQASLAVGLRVLHESGPGPGPGVVLVLLAVDDRVGGRFRRGRGDDSRDHHGDRSPGRADAVPRGPGGPVGRGRPSAAGHAQRGNGGPAHGEGHLARGRVVRREQDLRGRAGLRRSGRGACDPGSRRPFPGPGSCGCLARSRASSSPSFR
jgi:hypothetical protein